MARRRSDEVFDHVRVPESFPGISPVFRPERQDVSREIPWGTDLLLLLGDRNEVRVEILATRQASRREPGPDQLTERIN